MRLSQMLKYSERNMIPRWNMHCFLHHQVGLLVCREPGHRWWLTRWCHPLFSGCSFSLLPMFVPPPSSFASRAKWVFTKIFSFQECATLLRERRRMFGAWSVSYEICERGVRMNGDISLFFSQGEGLIWMDGDDSDLGWGWNLGLWVKRGWEENKNH